MKEISIQTRSRTDFLDITSQVQQAVSEADLTEGTATVFIPHTTAGVTINENADPDVMEDMGDALDRVVPWSAGYRHIEGNAAAHVKATLVGSSVQVLVDRGKLCLGTWQGIYFCEFDGPRTRRIWISAKHE